MVVSEWWGCSASAAKSYEVEVGRWSPRCVLQRRIGQIQRWRLFLRQLRKRLCVVEQMARDEGLNGHVNRSSHP